MAGRTSANKWMCPAHCRQESQEGKGIKQKLIFFLVFLKKHQTNVPNISFSKLSHLAMKALLRRLRGAPPLPEAVGGAGAFGCEVPAGLTSLIFWKSSKGLPQMPTLLGSLLGKSGKSPKIISLDHIMIYLYTVNTSNICRILGTSTASTQRRRAMGKLSSRSHTCSPFASLDLRLTVSGDRGRAFRNDKKERILPKDKQKTEPQNTCEGKLW